MINESGITRDLLKQKTEWWGQEFEVIDSGGFPNTPDTSELSLQILNKIKQALQEADILIMVLDGKEGLHSEDSQILKTIRKTGKAFLLFVNKVDEPEKTDLLTVPFFKLSSDLLSGSCEKNYAMDEIIEWIISQKKKKEAELSQIQSLPSIKPISKNEDQFTRLFVIGRANSGKSLLCNQILQKDRMIVSSKPGTTLDTVTDFFSHKDQSYFLSDNPGSRRGQPKEREKISFAKSRSELERADIALLVVDARLGPGRQEARLIEMCLKKHKPVLLIVNKMDLLKSLSAEEKKQKQEEIKRTFHFYPDLPIVFISAKTGYHKEKLFQMIESLKRKIQFRVSTSELNDFFMKVIRKAPAPVYGPSDVKFYYINQTQKQPPEFIAFANYPKGVTSAYKRFVINKIKDKWDLKGIPIAFHALAKR